MNVGLIDVDSHNFPNLALMKISAYHKSKEDGVEWCEPLKHYDIVYQSKVFNETYSEDIQFIPQADIIYKGGSGYAITVEDGKEVYHKELDFNLPEEIEHQFPDYSLYPKYTKNTAYGFLSRGCPNNCDFCVVSKKEGRCSVKVADLKEFWNGQKEIVLLDPNILACKERIDLIKQLAESKARIDFCQGLDARFMTEEVAKEICKCNIKMVHFAFDYMKNEKAILKGLKTFKEHCNINHKNTRCYILTNYDTTHEEDYYRVQKVIELGYHPYIMIYQKGTHDKFLSNLARYCNNSFVFRSCESFADYKLPNRSDLTCGDVYADIINSYERRKTNEINQFKKER